MFDFDLSIGVLAIALSLNAPFIYAVKEEALDESLMQHGLLET
jgi:hypothetical protein